MVITFLGVFLLHVIIVQVFYLAFSIKPLSLTTWLKTLCTSMSIVIVSEIYKGLYRVVQRIKTAKKGESQNFKAIGSEKN